MNINDPQTLYWNIRIDIDNMCNESFERDPDWYNTMFDIIENLYALFQSSNDIDNKKLFMKAIGMAYSCMVNNDTKDLLSKVHNKLILGIFNTLNNHYFSNKSKLSEQEIYRLIHIYKRFIVFSIIEK